MIDKKIYMLWTGTNEMSENRKVSINVTREKCNVELCVLYEKDIRQIEKNNIPFHPAYEYLSETHKADYIRCYLMHNYGGGYSDVKECVFDWNPYFNQLSECDKYASGYREFRSCDIATPPEHPNGTIIRNNYLHLIGNGNYIFKSNTPLTKKWFELTSKKLDQNLSLLKSNPSSFPQDHVGAIKPNGEISKYPLRWAEILGEIFHPLVFEYKEQVLKNLPRFKQKYHYR